MNKFLRRSMLFALALVVLTGFGCGTKSTDGYPGDEPMTEEEKVAAQQISSGIIYFAFDRYDLNAEAKQILSQKAGVVKNFPRLHVLVEGHCDERGTQEYNLALGERRARAAYDFLVNMGVNPAQLSMISYGKMHPAVEGSGEAVWAKNRRDEFKVSKPSR